MTRSAQSVEPDAASEAARLLAESADELSWNAPISDEDFDYFRDIAYRQAGISIADYKRNMVFRRVSKRVRALNLDSISSYREFLAGPGRGAELQNLVNVLTTNKTSFFRENHHFQYLQETALPALQARPSVGQKRLRIWSAGCSSGEEPYSIAMSLSDNIDDIANWDARILATDIDTEMLDHGRQGVYLNDFRGDIPVNLQSRFIKPADSQSFLMSPDLKALIAFRHLNLLTDWPMRGPFDMIFCRNVVIYFDRDTKRALFDRFAEILKPDGLLFIGHSESLFKISQRFEMVGQSVYRRIE